MSAGAASLHASCVVLGERGVLIRGPSGSGKSTLARRLVDLSAGQGAFARIVADDRVLLRACSGRIVAAPHPAIAGRLEVRGLGIVACEAESACILGLVVDLDAQSRPRMPDADAQNLTFMGLRLPFVQAGPGEADLVLLSLRRFQSFGVTKEPAWRPARS